MLYSYINSTKFQISCCILIHVPQQYAALVSTLASWLKWLTSYRKQLGQWIVTCSALMSLNTQLFQNLGVFYCTNIVSFLTDRFFSLSGIPSQRPLLLHLSWLLFLCWMYLFSGQYCYATGLYYLSSQWNDRFYTWSNTNMSHLILESRWVNIL